MWTPVSSNRVFLPHKMGSH